METYKLGSLKVLILLGAFFGLLGCGSGGGTTSSSSSHTFEMVPVPGNSARMAWGAIASSSDGTKIAAVAFNDIGYTHSSYVYTSTNSGTSWSERTSAGLDMWKSIASSYDGTKLAAADINGGIHVSTDSGVNWMRRDPPASCTSLTISGDGSTLVFVSEYSRCLYLSMDNGATWVAKSGLGARRWGPVTSSFDGSQLAVAESRYRGTGLFTSSDGGTTWTDRTGAGNLRWTFLATSPDGSTLAAIAMDASSSYYSYLYTSTDHGATWTKRTGAGQRDWTSLSLSADGSRIAATAGGFMGPDSIYTSTDGGVTWTQRTSAGNRKWWSISSSADGMKLAAVTNRFDTPGVVDGYIYTSSDGGVTWTERTGAVWGMGPGNGARH
jgi:hypothetical protein